MSVIVFVDINHNELISLIILIGLIIRSNNCNSNINCDNNFWYGIILNIWYDFIYKNNKNCVLIVT